MSLLELLKVVWGRRSRPLGMRGSYGDIRSCYARMGCRNRDHDICHDRSQQACQRLPQRPQRLVYMLAQLLQRHKRFTHMHQRSLSLRAYNVAKEVSIEVSIYVCANGLKCVTACGDCRGENCKHTEEIIPVDEDKEIVDVSCVLYAYGQFSLQPTLF